MTSLYQFLYIYNHEHFFYFFYDLTNSFLILFHSDTFFSKYFWFSLNHGILKILHATDRRVKIFLQKKKNSIW